MRRNYKRKKFHVSGICIFLVLIIFSVAFVLWAMKPDNFRNEKNKINSWLNGISFQDFYNAKSLILVDLSNDNIFISKRENEQQLPASLAKLFVIEYAATLADLDSIVPANSVALSHARKYRYIETNAAKDTLTKFGKGDKTPDPYTPEQVKALMQRVEGTVWEMPVILGGLYGMRRSEILGLRWRNVDLENNTFDVTEQLPSRYRQKQKSLKKWHRRNPTAESYPLRSLPARSSSNSLPCRKYRKNRQQKTESLTMTMTLL